MLFLLLSAVLFVGLILGVLIGSIRAGKRLGFMVDMLEDNESNVHFREQGLYQQFNKSLNRLKAFFIREKLEIREQEKYYSEMLDHVQTGVVVLDGYNVTYHNSRALSLLGLSNFNSLRQLSQLDPSLVSAFEQVEDVGSMTVDFFNESEQVKIRLSASYVSIRGKSLKIIIFDDISKDIQDSQDESWSRLIRVLTHEIMNTVTPISTLSQALATNFDKAEGLGMDVKAGLETISTSAASLIHFVEDYRSLSRVAPPKCKVFMVREFVPTIQGLAHTMGVHFLFEEKKKEILLYADKGQIQQILVNLVKNAVQAGATQVKMTADLDNSDNVVITVSNNGRPISKDASEQIFVPFFTTKKDGTGIGLSLSRQIMRLHNGSIRLTCSDEEKTVFTLIFR